MEQKKIAGEKSAEFLENGMTVGLGTGTTAFYMVKKVGELVKSGLDIKAAGTSRGTELLAKSLGIPVIGIDEAGTIDLVIDGVDQIDGRFNAVKGGGGALFREKIVASAAKEVIWIMDESKRVDDITRFPIPLEVLPFGYTHVMHQLKHSGFQPSLRLKNGEKFVTDNGNYIIDVQANGAIDVLNIKEKLDSIVGVLETGLFLNMCSRIVIGTDAGAEVYENNRKAQV
jgi:ribose 5-phosphate isomerase A